MAKAKIKLSEQWQGGKFICFKRIIGGQKFYLGQSFGVASPKDRAKAERAASSLEMEFERLGNTWTAASIATAKQIATAYAMGLNPLEVPSQQLTSASVQASSPTGAFTPAASPATANSIPSVPNGTATPGTLTLYQAIERFKAEQTARYNARKIGDDHFGGLLDYISKMTTDTDANGLIAPDQPINCYGRDAILRIVRYYESRPISKATGKPLSTQSVINILRAVGQFWRWAYEDDYAAWNGFRAWEKTFEKATPIELSSDQQHIRKGKPKYNYSELAALYSHATPRTRLYMLLALNCGMGPKEQATLLTVDCHLDEPTPYIDRFRHKTKVQGKWNLWAETATYLKMAMQRKTANPVAIQLANAEHGLPHNNFKLAIRKATIQADKMQIDQPVADIQNRIPLTDLALLTEKGFPMVHFTERDKTKCKGKSKRVRTSAIAISWYRLTRRKEMKGKVTNKGFYALRRTAGQKIKDIASLEASKIFLQHKALDASGKESVTEKHYVTRSEVDFARVAVATTELRKQLTPMFDAAAEHDRLPKPKNNYPKNRKPRTATKTKELLAV